jgi:predicted ATP-dependent endonuclease of OLD family
MIEEHEHEEFSEEESSQRYRSGSEDERKMRRRMQNRECARNLRQRRANYIRALEEKVEHLTREKAELEQALARLSGVSVSAFEEQVLQSMPATHTFDVDSMFEMDIAGSSISDNSLPSTEQVDIRGVFHRAW